MELTMYIFVNTDLKMGCGKICAQVGHVVNYITEHIMRISMINANDPVYLRYKKWTSTGGKKIVLKATEKDLNELLQWPESFSVRDAGHTQVAPNSLTVVGFFPSETLGSKVNMFKLL